MATQGTSVVETEILVISFAVSYGHVTISGQWESRSDVSLLGTLSPFSLWCLKLIYILVPSSAWVSGSLSDQSQLLW